MTMVFLLIVLANSRQMYQYERDIEKEEDYEIGWEWCFEDTGPLVAPSKVVFGSAFWIQLKTNQKISLMHFSKKTCTQL